MPVYARQFYGVGIAAPVQKEIRMDLITLNNSYKAKWTTDFGNTSSKQLETMWSDIFSSLNLASRLNAIRRRGITDVPAKLKASGTTVFSSTMGTGKTTSVQHYLQHMEYSNALVVVELIDTCDEYEDALKNKGAVAVHSGNGRVLDDNLNAPVVIITHERLLRSLKSGVADDELFNHFDLVVIDEQVNTYHHVEFRYSDLERYDSYLLDRYNLSHYFTDLMVHLSALNKLGVDKSDYEIVFDKLTAESEYDPIDLSEGMQAIDNIIEKKEYSDQIDKQLLEALRTKAYWSSKQGRIKVFYYQSHSSRSSFNIVLDFFPAHIAKVIFDGTASINDTYKLFKQHLGEDVIDVKHHHSLRTFKNATFMHYPIPSGRTSLTAARARTKKQVADVKETLKNLVQNCKARWGTDEEVLFIVHKDNAKMLSELLPANYKLTWWGRHVGMNDWKDVTKVAVFGLNYLPEETYKAMFYSTLSARCNVHSAPIDDLKVSMLSVDLLQGIFRGSLRKVIDGNGNCPEGVEVLCGLPNNHTSQLILGRLNVILNNINFEKVPPIKRVNSVSANRKKMANLLAILSLNEDSYSNVKSASEVAKELATPLRDILDRGANAIDNLKMLREAGWSYVTPTESDRETYGISGNARKVFRYKKVFGTEVTGTDVNGNEY